MNSVDVKPFLYSLEGPCPVPWSEGAEAQLHCDHPFLDREETVEDFVARRYLETLWLPESFNPLSHLIISLRRIAPSGDPTPATLKLIATLLQPLLLSPRFASDTYREGRFHTPEYGGDLGKLEGCIKNFVWKDERIGDEEWRKAQLRRLEQREVMIQILLYMFKLSLVRSTLSGAGGTFEPLASCTDSSLERDEDQLESFMDKIATWHLTTFLEGAQSSQDSGSSGSSGKQWTLAFLEDIVEPYFRHDLPQHCKLFRSKLLPDLDFSDDEDSSAETLLIHAGSPSSSAARARITRASSAASQSPSEAVRSRTRSLSLSLARDEVARRASVIGIGQKRSLSREVSMSRLLKEKPKKPGPSDLQKEVAGKAKVMGSKRNIGTTLIEETPVKRRRVEVLPNEQVHRKPPSQIHLVDPFDVISLGDTPILKRRH